MKRVRKLLALLLTASLLVGQLAGLDVGAIGFTAEDNAGLRLVQAMAMPSDWNYNLGVDNEKVIIPTFSNLIGNTYNSTKKTSLCLTIVGKDNDYSFADGLGNPLTWSVSMQWNNNIPGGNKYYARLDGSKMLHLLPITRLSDEQRAAYTTDIDTISEIFQLAKDINCRVMFRMWEQGTAITTSDGFVDSYYNGDTRLTGNLKVTSSGNVSTAAASNVYDCASIELTHPDDALKFLDAVYAKEESGARLQLTFSEPIDYSGRDADGTGSFWSGLRVLNAQGQTMAYDEATGTYTAAVNNADAAPLEVVLDRLWDIVKIAQSNSIIALDDTQTAAVDGLIAQYNDLCTADPEHEYTLTFAIAETAVKSRGEGLYNYFMDGLWSLNTDRPVIADYAPSETLGVPDMAAVPLRVFENGAYETPEESAKVLSVTTTDLHSRRITVTFDRPMHINKLGCALFTYEYAPSTSEEGFWQTGVSSLEYVKNNTYFKDGDGKEYSTAVNFFLARTEPYTAPAGMRFVEYGLNNSSAKNNDMISPLQLHDANGNGLYAPYADHENDLAWCELTLDPSLYELTAAVRISATQVRLLFSQPVTPVNVSATAGDTKGKVWIVESTADTLSLAQGDFTANFDGKPIKAAQVSLAADTVVDPTATYSFMNADTGRELAVGNVKEFTVTNVSGGVLLGTNGQYLDLTGAAPALTDTPIVYTLTESAFERWQIGVGNGLVTDTDGGTDAAVTLEVVSNAHDVINTGWYLTAPNEKAPNKVLFFGASKTNGDNTDFFDHGWRDTLSASITEYTNGRTVFVGSRLSHLADIDSAELYRHEGWSGWVLNVIEGASGTNNIALKTKVDADLIKYAPDIFFMDCGGNDVVWKNSANGGDILTNGAYSKAMNDLVADLIGTIIQYAPAIGQNGALLLQTTSPTRPHYRADADLFADMAQRQREMVAPLRAAGYNVFLNETRNGYPLEGGFCSDNHHNSDLGDAHVAARSFAAFSSLYDENGILKNTDANLAQALANAKDGDVVYLHGDLTLETELVVPAGVTLDLCGSTLTVPSIAAFGKVIDSTDGNGLLNLTAMSPIFRPDNPYLPLYDTEAEGYRLFSVNMNYRGVRKMDNDTVKFGVSPEFGNPRAYTLLQDAVNAEITLKADIHIRYNSVAQDIPYEFSADILRRLGEGMLAGTANTVVLTVRGVGVLESDDVITVAPALTSQTDASAVSTVGRYPNAGAVNPNPSDSIKILMIGNSFARDAGAYIHQIAAAEGKDITVGVLYFGGGGLDHHVNSINSDSKPYIYYENGVQKQYYASLRDGLEMQEWDVVSMQQNSTKTLKPETLNDDIDYIQNFVREYCPNPDFRFVWHATWSYKFTLGGLMSEDAYEKKMEILADKILDRSEIEFFIPSATAIQNVKSSFIGHDLHSDDLHLNAKGKYIAGYTWLAALTGYLPQTLSYRTSDVTMTDPEYAAIREAVANAIQDPLTVTPSTYTKQYTAEDDGIDLTEYTQLTFDYQMGYWNPANAAKYNQVITPTSATDIFPNQHIAISDRFTKETLPVGSVIVVDSGWKARFRYWNTDATHSGAGELITGKYVVTSETWDTEIYRAIHLMDTGQTYLSDAPDTHINHIRIYIPNEPQADLNADGLDKSKYVQLDPAYALGYWNPASTTSYNKPITSSSDNYHASHVAILERFTPDTLPVGSVIVIDSGYSIRFRYWTEDNVRPSSEAGAKLTAGQYTVTESDWSGVLYRAMHVMPEPFGTKFTDATADTAMSHIRIYVPRTANVNDDGIDLTKFTQWDYEYEVGYYNPSNSSIPTSVITPTNGGGTYAQNFIAVSDRVTPETLPVGSIIVVDDGYYVRFRYWNTDGYYANAGGETVKNRYAVGVQHWDTEIIRALHLSLNTIAKMSDNVEGHIAHLRIYIPKA